jgi:hypothetical protein
VGYVCRWFLPEPLDPKFRSSRFNLSDANPFHRLRRAARYRGFMLMAFPFCLMSLGESVYEFFVIAFRQRFNW